MRAISLPLLTGLSLLAAPAAGQDLGQRITGARNGEVRLSYASQPDVCGDGEHSIRNGRRNRAVFRDIVVEHENCPCEHGPVRVVLTVREHRVTGVRTWVGGQWRPGDGNTTDLGTVPARAAALALLDIAADPRHGGGEDAVFPATLADSVTIWPRLLQLAKDAGAPRDTRRQAVFWISQAAGDSATVGLQQLAENENEDGEVRKQAVFALSQRPKEEGVPVLIRIARTNRDPELRRSALFWLGQSDDPRALALFEELLVRK